MPPLPPNITCIPIPTHTSQVVSGIQQQADGEGAAGALSFLAQYCASLSVLVLTRSHLWLTSPTFPRLADLAGLHTLELRLCDLTAPMMPSSGYGGGSSGGGAAGGSTWGSGSNSNNGSSGGAGGAGGPGADALRALAQLQSLQVLVLEAWGSPIKQLDLGPLAALHQLRSFSLSAAPVGLVTGWQALAAGATRLHTLALHQVPVLTHTQAQLWDPYASSHPAASSSAAAGATAAGSAGLARPPASGAGGTAGGASAGPGPSAGSGSSSSAPAWQQGEHGQQQGQGQQGPGQQQQLEPCGWPSLRVLRAELMIPAQVLGFLQGQDMPVLAEVGALLYFSGGMGAGKREYGPGPGHASAGTDGLPMWLQGWKGRQELLCASQHARLHTPIHPRRCTCAARSWCRPTPTCAAPRWPAWPPSSPAAPRPPCAACACCATSGRASGRRCRRYSRWRSTGS